MEPISHHNNGPGEEGGSDGSAQPPQHHAWTQDIQPPAEAVPAVTSPIEHQPVVAPESFAAPASEHVFVPAAAADAPTPPAHAVSDFGAGATPTSPVPVVRVLSPVGIEYVFLTIALFTAAGGLTSALLSLVNGHHDFTTLAFPTALLVIGVPVFAWLFLRLKKMELQRPALVLDPSKRRSTQFTQIVSFLTVFGTLIGLVYSIFAKLGGQIHISIVKILLDCLVLLVVFGGMLAYYWRQERKGN